MTRIIYLKKEDGTLTNKYPMLLGTNFIKVVIDPSNLITAIYDQSDEVLGHFTSTNLLALKMRTKRELRSLGVQFTDEVRHKKVVGENTNAT